MPARITIVLVITARRLLPLVFLSIVIGVLSAPIIVWAAPPSQSFVVKIVGYEEKREFMAEYRVNSSDPAPNILSKVRRNPKTDADFFAQLLRELNQRREMRRQIAKTSQLGPFGHAKWVNPSPDGQYLFVGFEDPASDVMTNAVILKASNFENIKEFKLTGRSDILDSEWSLDSQFLAVLEISERYSKSFSDLISLLLSHPKPLNTMFVNFVNLRSGAVTRILVEKDVRFGTAVVAQMGQVPNGIK